MGLTEPRLLYLSILNFSIRRGGRPRGRRKAESKNQKSNAERGEDCQHYEKQRQNVFPGKRALRSSCSKGDEVVRKADRPIGCVCVELS